jgi:hypothetical protein
MLQKARTLARGIPGAHALYGRMRAVFRSATTNHDPVESIFAEKMQTNAWRGAESVSGRGSDLEQTRVIIRELPQLLRQLDAGTLLDVPCGDFNWMRNVELGGTRYIGGDIVSDLVARNQQFASDTVEFRRLDLLQGPVPAVDLILCRDCLVHLSFADGLRALNNLAASGSTWLLTTTFIDRAENSDIPTGRWRPLNLARPPYNLPPPEHLIVEQCTQGGGKYADKALGLWRMDTIGRRPSDGRRTQD